MKKIIFLTLHIMIAWLLVLMAVHVCQKQSMVDWLVAQPGNMLTRMHLHAFGASWETPELPLKAG